MNIPTKLLEYLVRECTKEVLDQIAESENETDPTAPPIEQPKAGNAPETPSTKPEETPEEPVIPKSVPTTVSGPVIVDPKDKSQLKPIKFTGRDDASVERTLYNIAASVSSPKTKVSLGARRLAREAASNPNAKIYFYIGKLDPESEELFLMADKSLQVAKDETVQPSQIQGVPYGEMPSSSMNVYDMTPSEYDANLAKRKRGGLTPRYGIDEQTKKTIKKAINKILDRK